MNTLSLNHTVVLEWRGCNRRFGIRHLVLMKAIIGSCVVVVCWHRKRCFKKELVVWVEKSITQKFRNGTEDRQTGENSDAKQCVRFRTRHTISLFQHRKGSTVWEYQLLHRVSYPSATTYRLTPISFWFCIITIRKRSFCRKKQGKKRTA